MLLRRASSSVGAHYQAPPTPTVSPLLRTPPGCRPARRGAPAAAVGRTAFSYESARLAKTLVTRQAIKTVLGYLSETNGELYFFLHKVVYVADHPLPLSPDTDSDEWLAALASAPLTSVADPRRSSVPSVAAAAAALQGQREVSPRDAAERILGLRQQIANELQEELQLMAQANADVKRRALERTVSDFKLE